MALLPFLGLQARKQKRKKGRRLLGAHVPGAGQHIMMNNENRREKSRQNYSAVSRW